MTGKEFLKSIPALDKISVIFSQTTRMPMVFCHEETADDYVYIYVEEEAAKAIDMGSYYRVPADNRDLNYDKYFVEGRTEEKLLHQYNSHNTERLDIAGTIAKMKTTDYIKEELAKLEK